ncbi:MAG: ribosome biogenesis GTP-binding protein YihA/YsxC [Vicinamibacterales bacterium]|jgi:GTP-binding protein|nr:ribosome biogenesis GTP-binding protein YihA/YsxC [Vicinamibacterales bacterium]
MPRVARIELLTSAAAGDGLPRDGLPQVALVGRSNVGKSSLINALTRSRVARTSAAPGKTRLLNVYRVEAPGLAPAQFYLVDLPGYGYARGGAAAAAGFDRLVGEYFGLPPAARDAPRGVPLGPTAVVHVVDARHPGLDADVQAMEWLRRQGRPVLAAASKIDKLTRAGRQRAERDWAKALNVPVLAVSAVTGEGLDQLWTQISRLLSSRPSPR